MINTSNRYRIVTCSGRFYAQYRIWGCPIWLMCNGKIKLEDGIEVSRTNDHANVVQAADYARAHARLNSSSRKKTHVVECLGPL